MFRTGHLFAVTSLVLLTGGALTPGIAFGAKTQMTIAIEQNGAPVPVWRADQSPLLIAVGVESMIGQLDSSRGRICGRAVVACLGMTAGSSNAEVHAYQLEPSHAVVLFA